MTPVETLYPTEVALLEAIAQVLLLEGQPLDPSPLVDRTFGTLVGAVERSRCMPRIQPENLSCLRRLCAEGEAVMEAHYARQITEALHPYEALETFPYLNNYRQLAELECSLLSHLPAPEHPSRRTAIIGSGPLPLSSYFYALYGHDVLNIDNNAQALRQGSDMLQRLHIKHENVHSPGEVAPLKAYNINTVMLAALAGETLEQKLAIVRHIVIELPVGGRLLLRSAKGAKQLLYPSVALDDEVCAALGLVHITSFHPPREVINSVEIYEKCA